MESDHHAEQPRPLSLNLAKQRLHVRLDHEQPNPAGHAPGALVFDVSLPRQIRGRDHVPGAGNMVNRVERRDEAGAGACHDGADAGRHLDAAKPACVRSALTEPVEARGSIAAPAGRPESDAEVHELIQDGSGVGTDPLEVEDGIGARRRRGCLGSIPHGGLPAIRQKNNDLRP